MRIKIKPSTVPKAGKGAFADKDIPKGAYAVYRGKISTNPDKTNMLYSWELYDYDPKTGKTKDDIIGYVDASKRDKSTNFARYVNCGPTSKANNMESVQKYDKVRYVATRDIKAGEELFTDYGEEYRRDNLGMKGKY